MTAKNKVLKKNNENKFICVGLDTDLNKIPPFLLSEKHPALKFNQLIIEATADLAAAYKINFAFYEKNGSKGIEELERTIELLPPDTLSIADAKRGDIGNTSQMYSSSVFEHLKFDSVTLNPYMGKDSLQPFLDYEDKLNFILVLTSNPGAIDIELLELKSGKAVYQEVLSQVKAWNKSNCGIVFGATKIDDLKKNISEFGDLTILLPGVGAQGGSLEEVISLFKQYARKNFLINVSRGIIYKSSGKDFDRAAREELIKFNFEIENKF